MKLTRRGKVVLSFGALMTLLIAYVAVMGITPLPALNVKFADSAVAHENGVGATISDAINQDPGGNAVAILSETPDHVGEGDGPRQFIGNGAETYSMASITKLITVLTALEKKPLEPGDEGETYTFSAKDQRFSQSVISRGGVAAQPSSGQKLTQRDMLTLMLLESANDITISYAVWTFGSEEAFVKAANEWLNANDFSKSAKLVEPTGLDAKNTATLNDMLRLGELALENPTVAAIVKEPKASIKGWGEVQTTNWFVKNQKALGIKTGTLASGYLNILVAEDDSRANRTLTTIVVTTQKADSEERVSDTKAIFDAVDKTLTPAAILPPKETVGSVTTWDGKKVTLTTSNDKELSTLLLPEEETRMGPDFKTVKTLEQGQTAGRIVIKEPADTRQVKVVVDQAIEDPGLWWRLTHPHIVLRLSEV